MRTKYLAILIAVAMLVVSGPLDIFALEASAGQTGDTAAAAELLEAEAAEDQAEPADTEGVGIQGEAESVEGSGVLEGTAEGSDALSAEPALSLKVSKGEEENSAKLDWTLTGYEPVPEDTYKYTVYKKDGDDQEFVETESIPAEPTADLPTEGEATVKDLTAGTEYTFKVELTSSSTTEAQPIAVAEESYTVNVQPDNVKSFKTLSGYKSVVLKWSKVEGADGYIIKFKTKKSGNYNKTITVKGGSKNTYTHKVDLDKLYYYQIFAYEGSKSNLSAKGKTAKGEAVRQIHYKVTFKTTRTLVEHKNGSRKANGSYKVTIKGGKTIECNGFYDGRYIFDYKCKDGKTRTFYVTRISIKNPKVSQVNNKRVYTETEAENFVNSLKISSNTKYLIWGSLYSQHMYVFKGSKGKWKLHKGPWVISSGKASMPTSTGLTRIKQKVRSEHGIPYWNVCNFYSIHGKLSKWTLGLPASGACMRNYTENALWVYKYCDLGTAVYVY